jgi:hypothetical protein
LLNSYATRGQKQGKKEKEKEDQAKHVHVFLASVGLCRTKPSFNFIYSYGINGKRI